MTVVFGGEIWKVAFASSPPDSSNTLLSGLSTVPAHSTPKSGIVVMDKLSEAVALELKVATGNQQPTTSMNQQDKPAFRQKAVYYILLKLLKVEK